MFEDAFLHTATLTPFIVIIKSVTTSWKLILKTLKVSTSITSKSYHCYAPRYKEKFPVCVNLLGNKSDSDHH